jgi:hypothetical protein
MPLQYRVAGIATIAELAVESSTLASLTGTATNINEELTFVLEGANIKAWYDPSTDTFKISSPAPAGGVKIHYRIAV